MSKTRCLLRIDIESYNESCRRLPAFFSISYFISFCCCCCYLHVAVTLGAKRKREEERERERENYIYSECGSTGKTGAVTAHAPPGLWAFPARRPSGDPVGLSKYSLRVDGLLITTSASSPTCSLVPVSSLVLSYSSRCFPTPPSSSKCDIEAQLGFSSL